MYRKPETQASVRKQRKVKRWAHPQCALSSPWNRIRSYAEATLGSAQLCRTNALLTASRTNEKSKGNWKTLCNAYLKKMSQINSFNFRWKIRQYRFCCRNL